MSCPFLSEYFSSCEQVTDCALVSKDGEQSSTHRVLLAARSEFFRDIFNDVTDTGIETVIVMPDHSTLEVIAFIEEIDLSDEKFNKEKLNEILFGEKEKDFNQEIKDECMPDDENDTTNDDYMILIKERNVGISKEKCFELEED